MTSSIITSESNISAEEAYEFLRSKRIRHLAVTEGGSIVWVVSVKDLMQK
jgi:CBS domain-containing protein